MTGSKKIPLIGESVYEATDTHSDGPNVADVISKMWTDPPLSDTKILLLSLSAANPVSGC